MRTIVNPAPIVSLVDVGYMTSTASTLSNSVSVLRESDVPKKKPTGRTSIKGHTKEFRRNRREKNMKIDKLEVASLPTCSLNCHMKSYKQDRQLIWEGFRQITDTDQRARYLTQLIHISTPKRFVVP